ncbi:hypothetical protein FM038_000895 [Shewanella eurypsychrophilus]|uniref:5-hmdU DNA kinase helical domain-containing protein n=1 Tax=Shewanella eurypsychrophilus TaxID=2593656 RepID=A0ABX6V6J3_9GAMM|nr:MULTISPECIES: hypothetical protein [Shewanella]QFU20572.1 hypothetical protein FS418_00885 [Shewanella sp. YLB-09]QFU20853.1 hypothetical protein FS418_02495 [Shewanella sp. YLB-09]QPG56141.1 hypothetical protein FM038_000895 [Shewanella eurypsychrophilus]
MNVETKVQQYREVRKKVWFEATRTATSSLQEHQDNQAIFREFVTGLCNRCQLSEHGGTDEIAAIKLWHKMWTVIRYAGIRSNIATNEILTIEDIFDNYKEFTSTDWDIEKHGSQLILGGSKVHQLASRSGIFEGRKPIANWSKNKRTVGLARDLSRFMRHKANTTPVIEFLTGGGDVDDVWNVLEHLQKINYKQRITALHLMMDLGFQVVKPDIVLSRLFFELGWTKDAIPLLPGNISIDDLSGKGLHGNKFHYTNSKMYRPVIELARQIVKHINPQELKEDIGWVTSNPIREFDFFMVKYGQEPEPSRGIVRKLYGEMASGCFIRINSPLNTPKACR